MASKQSTAWQAISSCKTPFSHATVVDPDASKPEPHSSVQLSPGVRVEWPGQA